MGICARRLTASPAMILASCICTRMLGVKLAGHLTARTSP